MLHLLHMKHILFFHNGLIKLFYKPYSAFVHEADYILVLRMKQILAQNNTIEL
jgi:hypothetical protein